MKNLHGVLVPIIIPMFEDGSLDLEGCRRLAETFLSLPSCNGLFALGATSEFMHLPFNERKILIELFGTVDRDGKVIMVNTGGLPLDQVTELTRLAVSVGLDGVAVVVPPEVPTEQKSVEQYFAAIGATGASFAVYWSPVTSQHRPSLTLVEKLMGMKNFVGLKDSSRDMVTFTDICTHHGSEISVFQGVEMLHLASLAVGSVGVVGGGLNLYPRLLAEITESFTSHDLPKARRLQQRVNESWEYIARGKGFRSLCKHYWKQRGMIQGIYCREGANLTPTEEQMKKIQEIAAV
jgi:dihydrodipicolinate synthase/N-acetylneuraminate lyase